MTTRFFKRWQFQASVLAPVVLMLVVAAATVASFLLWASHDLDSAALARERALAQGLVDHQMRTVPHHQLGVVVRDEAVLHTRQGFDRRWVEANLGRHMFKFFGHNRTFVLDASDRSIYAMDQGQTVNPDLFRADIETYQPIVDSLRQAMAAGSFTRPDGSSAPPQKVELSLVAGAPAVISVTAIASDSGDLLQPIGTHFLHVAVAYLDAVFADRLASEYRFADASFTRYPERAATRAALPVMSSAGRIVGFFEWTPERPGTQMLYRTAPALGVGFAIGVLLVGLLLHQLWRSSTDLERGRLAAQHQANHDALTGLANRSRFDEMLGRTVIAPRSLRMGVALLMLDLDRFKQVNDTLGHQSGDELIRAVGQRLGLLIGRHDTLARLGGDEFGIIHQSPRGVAGHLDLSNRIIDALSKPFETVGGEAFVGVSIGIVDIGEADTDRPELLRKADIALYEAKSTGRNRAVVYEEAMDELLQDRHRIEAELRDALRTCEQLSVAFQPLVSGQTGAVVGAEALVRWTHPRLGQVSPAQFVPVAEGTGLIEPIGEFVLRKACQLGARHPGMTIAVNISPVQLRNPLFAERVFDMLIETGMAPTDLEIEITEGILLDDEDVATASLRTFRGAGIRIALDDFGTGYSSLNYLKRYPVDCIKVDRSFVSQLEDGSVSAAIIQAMVSLAHALGIQVTAEGVETTQQRAILVAMNCNTLQGYLLSPPVDAAAIADLFTGRRAVSAA